MLIVNLPYIDQVALQIGPLAIRWYGLSYLCAFLFAWQLAKSRMTSINLNSDSLADLVFYIAIGVIIGGRVGYGLFYDWNMILHPWQLFMFWEPGRSFHGGLLGVVLSLYLFKRKQNIPLHAIADFVSPLIPLGLGFGRLGNFFNQELWGRVAVNSPLAVIYPYLEPIPRHPSQIYEALLEGFVLFALLWCYARNPRAPWRVTALFFIGYGLARFVCEWFREPDQHLGLVGGQILSMGQLLSLPMILIGLGLIYRSIR